jgi:hypothetical protein
MERTVFSDTMFSLASKVVPLPFFVSIRTAAFHLDSIDKDVKITLGCARTRNDADLVWCYWPSLESNGETGFQSFKLE